jgi:hypothetical protein
MRFHDTRVLAVLSAALGLTLGCGGGGGPSFSHPAQAVTVSTLAGDADFNGPMGLAVDGVGTVFVADTGNHAIKAIAVDGTVRLLVGVPGSRGSEDGPAAGARFNGPTGVAVDGDGNVYVADSGNSTLRKITPAGVVGTLAGTAGRTGSADGTGPAASFWWPFGVAVDPAGNVIVADTLNSAIRKITIGTPQASPTAAVARPGRLAPARGRKVLACLAQAQQHSEWCGVTACSCVLTYLGNPKSQCEIVNYMENIKYACRSGVPWAWDDPIANIYVDCCMGPRPSETDVLEHYGFHCTGRFSALSYAQIQEEIDAGRPFIILWYPAKDMDVHLIVGMGYDNQNGQQDVIVMNTGVYHNGITQMSYASLCANSYNGTNWPPYSNWDRTITIDPF